MRISDTRCKKLTPPKCRHPNLRAYARAHTHTKNPCLSLHGCIMRLLEKMKTLIQSLFLLHFQSSASVQPSVMIRQTYGTRRPHFSIFQGKTQNLKYSFSFNLMQKHSGRKFPGRTANGMSGKMKLLPEFCSICLSTFRSDGPTLVLSFPPLSEVGNVNGFYLMFFLLSHSPIWSPICQCHPRLWLSEFGFTRQTLLFSSLLMMLMVVMDCMNGNSFTGAPLLV